MKSTHVFCITILLTILGTNLVSGLEKEKSLVTGESIGDLAVAGKLDIDLHAEFMLSRTFDKDTALNWYNCGVSGGGTYNDAGGNFGNFGLDVPWNQRDEKYPHAVSIGDVPAVRFDGNDIMKGNFAVESVSVGTEDMALEVWLRDENPEKGEVILGWQSKDGILTAASLTYPKGFEGSGKLRHMLVNCTPETETWYVDGKKVESHSREMTIPEGYRMVLGGAHEAEPSFSGDLVAVRLHEKALTDEEIAHNFNGGPMLGADLHSWWRNEPGRWWVKESEHFRHCVDTNEMAQWNEKQLKEFHERVPGMFELAEKIYHLYSERHAMRSSVVSAKPEFRGDGIKYNVAIQPSGGSWMGWDGKLGFGWACQGAGHINPHELVHGWQSMTGGAMQGNYWEAHANFPQTYVGVYQTLPPACVSRVCMFFPANGRDYYHDRLMFEHLAQSPEYGPMFISKLWYDAGVDESKNEYPWTAFTKFDPDPSTPLGYEWTRMVQKCVTWDFEIFGDQPADLYKKDAERNREEMLRYAHITLRPVPFKKGWWRAPKEMTPQQLGYNICPLKIVDDTVSIELSGYISTERGSDWRAGFVAVDAEGNPRYSDIVGVDTKLTFDVKDAKELFLVVSAVPTKILAINMTGDFRSFEQEKFPYMVKLTGCEPVDVLVQPQPDVAGTRHPNGGGFVAATAQVEESAYVGPNAQVLGKSQVLGNARIEDYAVVQDSTVKDNAILSDHALVTGGSTVQDYAKVRDCGRVQQGATIKDYAKVIEHATQAQKVCGGYAVIKGVASSHGPVTGTAMIDGSYAKGNEIDKGKWFTWSWGSGKNPGEVDEEFGGLYMQMLFDNPHEWMARDDFGATWGYLAGKPGFIRDETIESGVLVLNGKNQYVELQNDVADMRDITIKARVKWQGNGNERILEFSNDKGEQVCLTTLPGGNCVFAIGKDGETQAVQGPALKKNEWTDIMVLLSENTGRLFINDTEVARNGTMTFNPDQIGATACYLGRGRDGGYFKGQIDNFEIYSVPVKDEVAPAPDPARFSSIPLFVNPETVVMQAEAGVDPLGGVEYFFEETTGNPGGDDSGWIQEPIYQDTGLEKGRTYVYSVKMRDACGNVTKPSATAQARWEEAPAFTSADGETIVIEAENFKRNVPGAGSGKDFTWQLSPKKEGCAGNGMMAAQPDRGVQIGAGFESQSPRLDYLIDFPAKGKYTIWMRSWGPNPNGDSVFMGLDMQSPERLSLFHIGNGKLQWSRHKDWSFEINEPGMHTFSVWMREDGCAFDRLILTTDRNFKPEGEGPEESGRK